ncbi:hypothetical protein P7C73_g2766, partial [Tremellales sp. Uapishka_1]
MPPPLRDNKLLSASMSTERNPYQYLKPPVLVLSSPLATCPVHTADSISSHSRETLHSHLSSVDLEMLDAAIHSSTPASSPEIDVSPVSPTSSLTPSPELQTPEQDPQSAFLPAVPDLPALDPYADAPSSPRPPAAGKQYSAYAGVELDANSEAEVEMEVVEAASTGGETSLARKVKELRMVNRNLKLCLVWANRYSLRLVCSIPALELVPVLGDLCGTFVTAPRRLLRCCGQLAMMVGSPIPSDLSFDLQILLPEIFARTLLILLRDYDPVEPRRDLTNDIRSYLRYHPPAILWAFVQLGEPMLLRKLRTSIQELSHTCFGTHRGVILRILLSRITDEVLEKNERNGLYCDWARDQSVQLKERSWKLEVPRKLGDIKVVSKKEVEEAVRRSTNLEYGLNSPRLGGRDRVLS